MSEKAMATHSSTLAWKIPWMEEPGGLQFMGSLRVGHYWETSLSLWRIGEGKGNPLQCSCLENPRDGGPGGLPSMGSHRVEHDWSDLAAAWRIFRWIHEIVTVVTSWKEHWRMKSTEWERNLLSKYLQRWITYVQICISENTIKPMSMK